MILTISAGKLISTGLLLGLGLTMDAAAVSMVNGLEESNMKKRKMIFIAFMYALFQALMPLIGYFFGNALYTRLPFIEKYHLIPICALIILLILGIKMVFDGINDIKNEAQIEEKIEAEKKIHKSITLKVIFIQTIATSIDALSTGLTFSNYLVTEALVVTGLIALVTFIVCMISLFIGKKFGAKLGKYALIIGGVILCGIGLEIFISGIFF